MAKTCPTAGKSNVQAVFACIEDVTGVLQKPVAADYIVPRGNASMNQGSDRFRVGRAFRIPERH